MPSTLRLVSPRMTASSSRSPSDSKNSPPNSTPSAARSLPDKLQLLALWHPTALIVIERIVDDVLANL